MVISFSLHTQTAISRLNLFVRYLTCSEDNLYPDLLIFLGSGIVVNLSNVDNKFFFRNWCVIKIWSNITLIWNRDYVLLVIAGLTLHSVFMLISIKFELHVMERLFTFDFDRISSESTWLDMLRFHQFIWHFYIIFVAKTAGISAYIKFYILFLLTMLDCWI